MLPGSGQETTREAASLLWARLLLLLLNHGQPVTEQCVYFYQAIILQCSSFPSHYCWRARGRLSRPGDREGGRALSCLPQAWPVHQLTTHCRLSSGCRVTAKAISCPPSSFHKCEPSILHEKGRNRSMFYRQIYN